MHSAAHRTTEEIVRAIREGREVEENYRELHQRYYPAVYRYFLHKGLKPEDARDFTQNTFFSVFTSIEDLQQESKFEGWLFAIALNGLRREWERAGAGKRKGFHVAIAPEEEAGADTIADVASPLPDPQTAMLQQERLELLHAALLELPEQRRRCTLLYINGELKYQQIADLMGISLNTVKAHLHQAKDSLRKKLSPHFNEIEIENR